LDTWIEEGDRLVAEQACKLTEEVLAEYGEGATQPLLMPKESDGWQVITHDIVLSENPSEVTERRKPKIFKKVKALAMQSSSIKDKIGQDAKQRQDVIEKLLGVLEDRPLAGGDDELELNTSQHRTFSFGHLQQAVVPTSCSLSTYMFGGSDIASFSDLDSSDINQEEFLRHVKSDGSLENIARAIHADRRRDRRSLTSQETAAWLRLQDRRSPRTSSQRTSVTSSEVSSQSQGRPTSAATLQQRLSWKLSSRRCSQRVMTQPLALRVFDEDGCDCASPSTPSTPRRSPTEVKTKKVASSRPRSLSPLLKVALSKASSPSRPSEQGSPCSLSSVPKRRSKQLWSDLCKPFINQEQRGSARAITDDALLEELRRQSVKEFRASLQSAILPAMDKEHHVVTLTERSPASSVSSSPTADIGKAVEPVILLSPPTTEATVNSFPTVQLHSPEDLEAPREKASVDGQVPPCLKGLEQSALMRRRRNADPGSLRLRLEPVERLSRPCMSVAPGTPSMAPESGHLGE
jgi:hypothetical protein